MRGACSRAATSCASPPDPLARGLRRAPLVRRVAVALAVVLLVPAGSPAGSPARSARTIAVVAANQSFNWSGYMQGVLEKGTTFHAVGADWIVPKVKQRNAGEAEFSSSWIGIGGGCLDAACTIGDATLIQAGIGHDVDASGQADYYAWWETIPLPLIRTDLPVRSGDRVRVSIVESTLAPEVWTITIANLDSGGSFTITLPYASTHATAEWVIETPLVITDAGVKVGPMPDLAVVHFDAATANGLAAGLIPSEQIQLVDFDLSPIAEPSVPDRDADGFHDCAYRKRCPAPGNELK